MKKTYIYLAVGAGVAWWLWKKHKSQNVKKTLVLLEIGKPESAMLVRKTYSDGTVETETLNKMQVKVLKAYAEQVGAEIRTDVDILGTSQKS